jgi:hypothetical protein
MKVKAGREAEYLKSHEHMDGKELKAAGLRKFSIIKTGERTYCVIGEWDSFDSLAKARPVMIAQLDRMRDMLEDLGGGLGVTDPVSGEVVFER